LYSQTPFKEDSGEGSVRRGERSARKGSRGICLY
jgi:hypothetical protein